MNWTHSRRAVMEDPAGLHARCAALLLAHLRLTESGTRFGLRQGQRIEDFGEAAKVGALALLGCVECGEEVEVLASGPGAGYVLDVVEETFSHRSGSGTHSADWSRIKQILGSQGSAVELAKETFAAVATKKGSCGSLDGGELAPKAGRRGAA